MISGIWWWYKLHKLWIVNLSVSTLDLHKHEELCDQVSPNTWVGGITSNLYHFLLPEKILDHHIMLIKRLLHSRYDSTCFHSIGNILERIVSRETYYRFNSIITVSYITHLMFILSPPVCLLWGCKWRQKLPHIKWLVRTFFCLLSLCF